MTPREAYQIGFIKAATSRWREALRSGEVSGSSADQLRERMNFEPERFQRGAEKAVANVAQKLDFGVGRYEGLADTARQGLGLVRRGFQQKNFGELAPFLTDQLLGRSLGGAGVYSLGGSEKRFVAMPSHLLKTINRLSGIKSPATRAGDLASSLQHERAEMEGLARFKPFSAAVQEGRAGPMTVMDPRAAETTQGKQLKAMLSFGEGLTGKRGLLSQVDPAFQSLVLSKVPGAIKGQHFGARPLLEDLREARLFGGDVQARNEALRSFTGERPVLQQAAQNVTGSNIYPRRQLGQIAREVRQGFNRNREQLLSMENPTARNMGQKVRSGVDRLRKLLGRG